MSNKDKKDITEDASTQDEKISKSEGGHQHETPADSSLMAALLARIDYMNALPFIERKRLPYDQFCHVAQQQGLPAPSLNDWYQTLELTESELRALNQMIEAQRGSFCVEELGPKFVIRDYGNKARVAWFDEDDSIATMSFHEFYNAYIEMTIEVDEGSNGKPKFMPLTKYWLAHPLTRRYDRVEFRPGVSQGDMPDGVLNIWRGWRHPYHPGWEEVRLGPDGPELSNNTVFDRAEMPERYCDMFLEHMLENMCGGDEALLHYLLAWMADSLWNPGPSDTAIILQGPQGSGKTFWVERFMEFFGNHALILTDDNQLLGNFNKHLMNKCLIFADEAFFAGNRRHAAKLKTLITGTELFVEPKGVDAFPVKKMFRLIMASNDEHVIRAEHDDRRNLVLHVDAGDHNQDRNYFAAMLKEWREGGGRAFFRWLTGAYWGEVVADGKFRLLDRPVTVALQEQKNLSLPPAQMALHNALREGELPCDFLTNDREGSVFVPTRLFVKEARLKDTDERTLGEALRILAGAGAKSVRAYMGTGRDRRQHRGFWLPPLEVCRERWERRLGRAIAWPDDVTTWGIESGPSGGAVDDPMPF